MNKTYKPKAKNETALRKYIKNATKKSIAGHKRSSNGKR